MTWQPTTEQQTALAAMREVALGIRPNVTLHAQAGTGKSGIVRDHLIPWLIEQGIDYQVVTPTHRAAQVYRNHGVPVRTVSSFFFNGALDDTELARQEVTSLYDSGDVQGAHRLASSLESDLSISLKPKEVRHLLIVDECCFVDEVAEQTIRESATAGFIAIGDPFQLPPVKARSGFLSADLTLTEVKRGGPAKVAGRINEVGYTPALEKSLLKRSRLPSVEPDIVLSPVHKGVDAWNDKKSEYRKRPVAGDKLFLHTRGEVGGRMMERQERFDIVDVKAGSRVFDATLRRESDSKEYTVYDAPLLSLHNRKFADSYLSDARNGPLGEAVQRALQDSAKASSKVMPCSRVIRAREFGGEVTPEMLEADQNFRQAHPEAGELVQKWLDARQEYRRLNAKLHRPVFRWGWATTIHKAQGGEYPRVHIEWPGWIGRTPMRSQARQLLYTAWSRGQVETTIRIV